MQLNEAKDLLEFLDKQVSGQNISVVIQKSTKDFNHSQEVEDILKVISQSYHAFLRTTSLGLEIVIVGKVPDGSS